MFRSFLLAQTVFKTTAYADVEGILRTVLRNAVLFEFVFLDAFVFEVHLHVLVVHNVHLLHIAGLDEAEEPVFRHVLAG